MLTETQPDVQDSEKKILLNRVFRADMRASDNRRKEILSELRQLSFLCAQFSNLLLTSNYLLYKHKGAEQVANDQALSELLALEKIESKDLYRSYRDALSSYCRDAITRQVSGIIKSRGKEVLRGDCALPTFRRRGAIRVRDRGVKLVRKIDGGLECRLSIQPGKIMEIPLWIKNLYKSPGYAAVLDRIVSGEHKISQAQVIIVDNWKVSLRIAYHQEVEQRSAGETAELKINLHLNGFILDLPERQIHLDKDLVELGRRKMAIDARRVQCWRLLRGRKLRKRKMRWYRSGTLSGISKAWINTQKTWTQQFAALVVRILDSQQASKLTLPSVQKLGESSIQLDWTQFRQAIKNACEESGIEVQEEGG